MADETPIDYVSISELQSLTEAQDSDLFLITRDGKSYNLKLQDLSSQIMDSTYQKITDNIPVGGFQTVDQIISEAQKNRKIYFYLSSILRTDDTTVLAGTWPSINAVKQIFNTDQAVHGRYSFEGLSSSATAQYDDDVVTLKDMNDSPAMISQITNLMTNSIQGCMTTQDNQISSFYVDNQSPTGASDDMILTQDKSKPIVCYVPNDNQDSENGISMIRIDIYMGSTTATNVGIYGYGGTDGKYGQQGQNISLEKARTDISNSLQNGKFGDFSFFGTDTTKNRIWSKTFCIKTPMWLCVFPNTKSKTNGGDQAVQVVKFSQIQYSEYKKSASQAISNKSICVYGYGIKSKPFPQDAGQSPDGKVYCSIRLKKSNNANDAKDTSINWYTGKVTVGNDGGVTIPGVTTIPKSSIYSKNFYRAKVVKKKTGYIIPDSSKQFPTGSSVIISRFS